MQQLLGKRWLGTRSVPLGRWPRCSPCSGTNRAWIIQSAVNWVRCLWSHSLVSEMIERGDLFWFFSSVNVSDSRFNGMIGRVILRFTIRLISSSLLFRQNCFSWILVQQHKYKDRKIYWILDTCWIYYNTEYIENLISFCICVKYGTNGHIL